LPADFDKKAAKKLVARAAYGSISDGIPLPDEPVEDGDDDDDGDGDDDDDDEDEDEEEEEEDDDDDEDDEEETDLPLDPRIPPGELKKLNLKPEDNYFLHNETMRNKFNEVEIDSFMKLLNINPKVQWEDETVHMFKVGTKTYEDEAQETDPYFYLLAEVERKHA